jgi:hypothetical protein
MTIETLLLLNHLHGFQGSGVCFLSKNKKERKTLKIKQINRYEFN